MPKRPDTNFEIVETEHEFHEASEKYSSRVTLATKQQEEAYSEIDNRFACSIDQLVKDYLSSEVIEKHYHQNYDWWPTQTRFLSFNAQVVNWDLIKKLRTSSRNLLPTGSSTSMFFTTAVMAQPKSAP